MEALFKDWTSILAMIVEACAAIIIGLAAVQATVRGMQLFLTTNGNLEETKSDVRLSLGRWLALGLEFELAADILRTAVAPTWNEIARLAAIIVIRTSLNFFLEREIRIASQLKQASLPNAS